MHQPDIFGFKSCGSCIQEILVNESVAGMRVNGEISHTERSEILEKMRALRRVYMVVLDSRFNDNPCLAYVGPFHGNSEPGVTAAPPSRTDEHITLVVFYKSVVKLFYFPSHKAVVLGIEILGFDIHNVINIVHNALSQDAVALDYSFITRNGTDILLHFVFGINNRTYLQ